MTLIKLSVLGQASKLPFYALHLFLYLDAKEGGYCCSSDGIRVWSIMKVEYKEEEEDASVLIAR